MTKKIEKEAFGIGTMKETTEEWKIKKSEESSEKREKLEGETLKKYEEWQNAENEERRIKEEIDKGLEKSETIEKYRDLYKAKKESKRALREYMLAYVKSNPELAEEYDFTKQDYANLGVTAGEVVERRKKIFGEE